MSDMALGQQGVLQVVPPAELEKQLAQRAQDKAAAAQPQAQDPSRLAQYVRGQYEIFRNHRNTSAGWSNRLLTSLRAFNGQYEESKLIEIRRFGGSEVYARLIAQKCRAASSLLRDIYLGQDRPWSVRAPQSPDVPDNILKSINQLLQQEQQHVQQQLGQPPQQTDVQSRRLALMQSAEDAAKKKAVQQAKISEDKIEDLLRQGGFYNALAEFLVDLPVFPFGVLKGPVVRVKPRVVWPPNGGMPAIENIPTLTWNRVSPFDTWFTPGVADIRNADVIEKLRITRAELNDLLDLPGYNVDEIRAVLDEYGRGGLYDNWDTTDAERAVLESRENPAWNRSAMLSMMEFNGNVQGRLLQDYGMAVPDELRDYHVQLWIIGSHVIKAHLSPSPRQRHPYFITSFEKVPGTPVGNSLSDLLGDIQEVANGCLRALTNNLSISSGPQVVVDTTRLSSDESGEDLYPWKRWRVRRSIAGDSAGEPISFFQPQNNSQALMQTYNELIQIADDVSAIPKYIGGQANSGGAGRTASGLAMLMGNASKILQTVSSNIDRDVIEEALTQLTDLIMLTDKSGLLNGEEKITVEGVNVAVQRETLRQRQIEFLQATINPTDMKIMGLKGRAAVLRPVSQTIGLDGDEIVPSDEILDRMQQQEQQQQMKGPIDQKVNEAVVKGVAAGVQRITTEITAGELAQQEGMPEGAPTHLGTPPGVVPGGQSQPVPSPNGGQPGQTNAPAMDMAAQRARVGQGTQRGPIARGGMAPQTHLVGNQPGARAMPLSPGVG
jgi:hypothetical protein